MLEEAHFVYGPIRATVEYAGEGLPPPSETARRARLWDIFIRGPGGIRHWVRDWSPVDEKPDQLLLGSMVRAAILELERAYVNPEQFRLFATDAGTSDTDINAAIATARGFGRHIRRAAEAALRHAERIEHGGEAARGGGPKEWYPGM